MADTGFDVGKLMENKLFLQYLSGAGAAISAGEPVGPALNQVTQQNISSQNFMKLLQKMMGDAANPETAGKASFDGTKFTYSTDMSNLGKSILGEQEQILGPTPGGGAKNVLGGTGENTALAQEGSKLPGGSGKDWAAALNPSASSAISGADLAGLTPEMISQALRLKLAGQELDQRKLSDIAEQMYKSEDLSIKKQNADIATYNALNKDERTPAVKNYEYAVGQGYKGSFTEFEKDAKTTHQKEYEQAVSQGYEGNFQSWLRDITALGGGLNLEDYKARREVEADIGAKKYFTDPKGLVADVDKHINSEEIQNQLFTLSGDPKKREVETVRAKEKFIRSKIAATGGKIVSEKLEGRAFVFKVKWADGSTSEVRYVN